MPATVIIHRGRRVIIRHQGIEKPLWEWAHDTGILYTTLHKRIERGRVKDLFARSQQRHLTLDYFILEHVGRFPVSSTVLHARVEADYGDVGIRTFYRHLKRLSARGKLTREVTKHDRGADQYVYSKPRGVTPSYARRHA